MKKLILHPTDISQWYALVSEAEAATQLVLNENTESYLVFLLQRFAHAPQLAESILALDFLESMAAFGKKQIEKLTVVGDKSLLLCGLFPGVVERRNVQLDYYVDMGKAAYLSVSELQNTPDSELFLDLSTNFPNLQTILQALRGDYQQFSSPSQCPLELQDRVNKH